MNSNDGNGNGTLNDDTNLTHDSCAGMNVDDVNCRDMNGHDMNGQDGPRSGPRRQSAREYIARFLLLFGPELAPRIVLLDDKMQFLTELVDNDGFIVDDLLRRGIPCAPPVPSALQSLGTRFINGTSLRCFALT